MPQPPQPRMFSRNVHTETAIEAPAEEVWARILDFDAFGRWNPVMTHVSGQAEVGGLVDVRFDLGLPIKVRCRVRTCSFEDQLRWRGGPVGLLAGEHYFACRPLSPGRTRFIHGETFSGALVPAVWPIVAPRIIDGYARMNRALKDALEGDLLEAS